MGKDREAAAKRERHWKAHIDAWHASGQTQKTFCKAHRLKYANFCFWLRRFRAQGTVEPTVPRQGASGDQESPQERCEPSKRQAVTWAQRLPRVFRIEIERCGRCGGQMKVIGAIEDPAVIERILRHVGELEEGGAGLAMAGPRGPPG